jgi:hypothetical protein
MRLEIELDNISTELKNALFNVIYDRFRKVENDYNTLSVKAAVDQRALLDCPHKAEGKITQKLIELKEENKQLLLEFNELRKAAVTFNIHSSFDEKGVLERKRQWEEERYEKKGA